MKRQYSYYDGGDYDGKRSSHQQREPKKTELFIGRINYNTPEDMLREYFSKYGTVHSFDVILDNKTGQSKGIAFLNYESSESVDMVMDNRPHRVDGRQLEVKRNLGQDPEARIQVKKLFIRNMKDHTKDMVEEHFGQFGNVMMCQMPMTPAGRHKGYCFVEYDDFDPVDKALLSGPHIINDQEVIVAKFLTPDDKAVMSQMKGYKGDAGDEQYPVSPRQMGPRMSGYGRPPPPIGAYDGVRPPVPPMTRGPPPMMPGQRPMPPIRIRPPRMGPMGGPPMFPPGMPPRFPMPPPQPPSVRADMMNAAGMTAGHGYASYGYDQSSGSSYSQYAEQEDNSWYGSGGQQGVDSTMAAAYDGSGTAVSAYNQSSASGVDSTLPYGIGYSSGYDKGQNDSGSVTTVPSTRQQSSTKTSNATKKGVVDAEALLAAVGVMEKFLDRGDAPAKSSGSQKVTKSGSQKVADTYDYGTEPKRGKTTLQSVLVSGSNSSSSSSMAASLKKPTRNGATVTTVPTAPSSSAGGASAVAAIAASNSTDLKLLLKAAKVSDSAVDTIESQNLMDTSVLETLTAEEYAGLGLNLGDQKRIKIVLTSLQ